MKHVLTDCPAAGTYCWHLVALQQRWRSTTTVITGVQSSPGARRPRRSRLRLRSLVTLCAPAAQLCALRPIATSLLGIAVMLGGMLGYMSLPVSSLPQVDFPTIQVTTQLPGASPDVMASLVTAPLERNFGQIPSLQLMTSSSASPSSADCCSVSCSRSIVG
jgi:AcrB/AcrD/AcrF family